jgi:osmotically-inducible protein OsmY
MAMPTIRRPVLAFAACMMFAGCTQQDSECLARIGRKVLERSSGAAAAVREQIDGDFKGFPAVGAARKDAGLKEQVETRLRWDALLADVKIEVQAVGAQVELKGTVKNDSQRDRVLDLAEKTAGVQAVVDRLQILEEP